MNPYTPQLPASALWAAKVLLAIAFVYIGGSKLLNFGAAIDEANHLRLGPAVLIAATVLVTQLTGAALMLLGSNQWSAVGALVLAAFTVVASVIGHPFWRLNGMAQFNSRNAFLEHLGVVGGLPLIAALSWDWRVH